MNDGSIPAVAYLCVGVTAFVLSYATIMDERENGKKTDSLTDSSPIENNNESPVIQPEKTPSVEDSSNETSSNSLLSSLPSMPELPTVSDLTESFTGEKPQETEENKEENKEDGKNDQVIGGKKKRKSKRRKTNMRNKSKTKSKR